MYNHRKIDLVRATLRAARQGIDDAMRILDDLDRRDSISIIGVGDVIKTYDWTGKVVGTGFNRQGQLYLIVEKNGVLRGDESDWVFECEGMVIKPDGRELVGIFREAIRK